MDQEAQRNHYKLIITTSHDSVDQERSALSMLKQRQADGAILLSPVLTQSEFAGIDSRYPIVQCCEYTENSTLPHVSIDNYTASFEAAEHLIRMGHKKIAMVSSTNHFSSTTQRELGFNDALKRYDIMLPENYLLRGNYSFSSGYEKMKLLLSNPAPPSAVIAISDTVAAGCLAAIDNCGLSCPKDVSVIGFDNIQLSTVSQPRNQLGVTAVQILLDRLNGNTDNRQIFLPHELVIRQSS